MMILRDILISIQDFLHSNYLWIPVPMWLAYMILMAIRYVFNIPKKTGDKMAVGVLICLLIYFVFVLGFFVITDQVGDVATWRIWYE